MSKSGSLEEFRKLALASRAAGGAYVNVPKCHSLKIDQKHFASVASGDKKSEVRKDDRLFMRGDFLLLHEVYEGQPTGQTILVRVSHIETYAQKNIYVVLSVERI